MSLYKSSDFAIKSLHLSQNLQRIDISCDLDEVKESEADSDNMIIDKTQYVDQISQNVTLTLITAAHKSEEPPSLSSEQRSSVLTGTLQRESSGKSLAD